ncbi:MAG: efflux RND transporter periplasmic adaptor subunit [Chthoniobacter sp.]|nr:efflux RND transporter periplasmic adaptor subunit [Chthoniobacter sp.]
MGLGILAAVRSARTLVPTPMVSDAPTSPYQTFVAGAGLIEANTENIAIGTQIAGIVSQINVQIGCQVKKGEPLFTIDDRATRATLDVQEAAIKVAESQLAQAQYEFKIGADLVAKHVISTEDAELRRYAVDTTAAQLAQARAQALATATDLERLTVRAPVDGQVLQLKIHPGEFAPTGVLQQPLILFGSVTPMCIRVDVDENDAWRVRAGTTATGYLRGNKDIHVPLKFVRFEPYVIPKVSLTGESTERVDTRVLQAIFSFERGELPISVGQQMDVYIDAGALPAAAEQHNALMP